MVRRELARYDRLIRERRIDVGTQEMTGDAGFAFNDKHILSGETLTALEPFPDRSLRNTAKSRKSGLRAAAMYCG